MRLTIKMRMYIAFAMILSVMGAVNIYSNYSLEKIQKGSDGITNVWLVGIDLSHKIKGTLGDYRSREYMHIITEDDAQTEIFEKELQELRQKFEGLLKEYSEVIHFEKETAIVSQINKEWKNYISSSDELLNLSRANRDDEAMSLALGGSNEHFRAVNNLVIELTIMNNEEASEVNIENEKIFESTKMKLISLSIIMVIVSFIISSYIGRYLSKRMGYLKIMIEDVSKFELLHNDLSEHKDIKGIFKDEVYEIEEFINSMRDNLREMVSDIKNNSDKITSNSKSTSIIVSETSTSIEGVAMATDELAHGATSLTINIQNGVTQLDMLSKQIDESVDNSINIKEYIEETNKSNKDGMKYVKILEDSVKANSSISGKVVERVEMLNNESESIGKVIGVINSITEQINLLSLNAAIEAARAGEHGKGFAVVADEIRKLASETAISTNEVEEIVVNIKREVDNTKLQVVESISAIEQTNEASENTKRAFEYISEQVSGMVNQLNILTSNIQAINKNKDEFIVTIDEISAIAQESAASTEEISASMEQQSAGMNQVSSSSDELNGIVCNLEDLVGKFKI